MTDHSADIAELTQLTNHYAVAVDSCDIAKFQSVFAPDGRLRSYHPGADEPFADLTGHDQLPAIPNAMRDQYRHTMHMMTTHAFDIDGDSATGEILCTARHLDLEGKSALNVNIRYVDRFERHDGKWLITDRQIRFLWSEQHDAVDSGFGR